MMEREPSEMELLLPWHAAGTLNARDSRKIDQALARDPELARQYAVVREEYAETIDLNESLGSPSARAVQKLFAAIDAEPAPSPTASLSLAARLSGFFASLSPRTLAWSASLGALVVILQGGVIGTMLMSKGPGSFEMASLNDNEPITRDLGSIASPHALVRLAPDARLSDVTALLDKYQASIVEGSKSGMFRLRFANAASSKDEFSSLLNRLRREKIVNSVAATP
jgi:hypothetical protein